MWIAALDWSAGLYDGVRHETGYCPGSSPLYWAGHLVGRLRDYERRVSIAVRYGAWVRHSELYGRPMQAPVDPAWAYRLGYTLQRFERRPGRHERGMV